MRWFLVAGLVLSGVACSSDGGGSDDGVELETTMPTGDPGAVDVITASILAEAEDPNALQYDEPAATCMAERVVAGFEPARLEELGLDVAAGVGPDLHQPPLTGEEGDATFEIIRSCVDLLGQLAEGLAGGGPVTEVETCVAERYLESGLLRESMLNRDFDEELNDRIDATLNEAFASC